MTYKNIYIELPTEVTEILQIIEDYRSEAYVVGGCCRDAILGRPVHDYDICTPVDVNELAALFENNSYKVIPTGIKHGTVTVMKNGTGYEITTYRKDGTYSDGRHPDTVDFTSDLEEDLARRDFTVNAMAYNPKVGLVDPFNGYEDLCNKIIRCVGNPEERFNEDGLRIMRAIRFSAQLDFDMDLNTEVYFNCVMDNLDNVSQERIHDELCKIMLSDRPDLIIYYNNVLYKIVPEMQDVIDLTLAHKALCLSNHKNLIVKLAILFYGLGAKTANNVMMRLRFDNDMRHKVVDLIYDLDKSLINNRVYIKKLLSAMGVEHFERLLMLKESLIKAEYSSEQIVQLQEIENIRETLRNIMKHQECFRLKDLAINGDDVKSTTGLEAGRRIGVILSIVLDKVIKNELTNNRDVLISWMRERKFYDIL